MMRYWYLLKLLRRWSQLGKLSSQPFWLLWKAFRGSSMLPLRIGEGGAEVELHITLPNLYGLLLLVGAGLRPRVEGPEELAWELAPGKFFHTRLQPGMDLMTLYEIFVRQDYGSDFRGQVVLDVGAYNGDSAVFFALQGAKRVVALEPYPPSFELAEANIARLGLRDRIVLLRGALGAEEGCSAFRVASGAPDANSLSPTPLTWRLVAFDAVMEVPVYSLERLMAEYGPFDFVKLDCEGCEFALIGRVSDFVLQAVPRWHIEYHASPAPLERRFQALGFRTRRAMERFGLGYLRAERQLLPEGHEEPHSAVKTS